MNYSDYYDAGLRIVPLYGITKNGGCECGNPECAAVGKHPRISSWQQVPLWSEEQMDGMEQAGFFSSGFGFVLDAHLVLDVDPRNQGDESYTKLCADFGIDFEKESAFEVWTGGGGRHIYFTRPKGLALVSNLPEYPGVDLKGSGYIVGAGSTHASGNVYDGEGDLENLTPAPQALLDALEKKSTYRTRLDGEYVDVSENQIHEMLQHIPPDCSYDEWVSVGMAVHQATQGGCFDLWNGWSGKGSKYPGNDVLERKWHSFGKSANPVTIGTLIHKARQQGYVYRRGTPSVEVHLPEESEKEYHLPCETEGLDLLRPPGFVGELTQWINSQCLFRRENLAAAVAISTVGNIGGLRFRDARDDVTANTIFLCVAGSGTGKEAILNSQTLLMEAAGISPAIHGAIKSEQEMVRNILRHQAAYYLVDEIGYIIKKMRTGTADYLKGVIPTIMSMYTKARSNFLISGDLKEEMRMTLQHQLSAAQTKVDANEDPQGHYTRQAEYLRNEAIPSIDTGIKEPFLSIMGFTTPISFHEQIDAESVMNGFINRSCIIQELETNPRPKRTDGFIRPDIPNSIKATLKHLYSPALEMACNDTRISYYGQRTAVETTDEASFLLKEVAEYYWSMGEQYKAENGFEALCRRGYEMVAKISFILAIPGELREFEHVRWAFAFVLRDIEHKASLASMNIEDEMSTEDGAGKILSKKIKLAVSENGETISTISRRVGKRFSKDDTEKMLKHLAESGEVVEFEYTWGRGRSSIRYKIK